MRLAEWHQRQAQLRLSALNLLSSSENGGLYATERRALAELLPDGYDERSDLEYLGVLKGFRSFGSGAVAWFWPGWKVRCCASKGLITMAAEVDDLVLAVEQLAVAQDRTEFQTSDGAQGDDGENRDG